MYFSLHILISMQISDRCENTSGIQGYLELVYTVSVNDEWQITEDSIPGQVFIPCDHTIFLTTQDYNSFLCAPLFSSFKAAWPYFFTAVFIIKVIGSAHIFIINHRFYPLHNVPINLCITNWYFLLLVENMCNNNNVSN